MFARKRIQLLYGLFASILFLSGCSATNNAPSPNTISAVSSNSSADKNASAPGSSVPLDASPSNDVGNKSSASSNVVSTQPKNSNSASRNESGTNNSSTVSTSSSTSATCRSNWSAGVYHTYRFDLLSPCKTAAGTVEDVIHEADHDYHIRLKLDPKYTNLLASGNSKYQHGDLVVEIIPMDQPYVSIPSVGQHITVTGAWVDDKDHGWNEIHPAWLVNGKGHIGYTAASARQSVITGICGNGDKDCPNGTASSTTSKSTSSSATNSSPTSSVSGLKVVASTLSVSPGSMASVEIQTKPGVQGQITVEYSSGPSKSSSLHPKTSDSQGYITWTWKVGSRTKAGDWSVTITASGKTIHLTLHVK